MIAVSCRLGPKAVTYRLKVAAAADRRPGIAGYIAFHRSPEAGQHHGQSDIQKSVHDFRRPHPAP